MWRNLDGRTRLAVADNRFLAFLWSTVWKAAAALDSIWEMMFLTFLRGAMKEEVLEMIFEVEFLAWNSKAAMR